MNPTEDKALQETLLNYTSASDIRFSRNMWRAVAVVGWCCAILLTILAAMR